jgi:hypothetical protein
MEKILQFVLYTISGDVHLVDPLLFLNVVEVTNKQRMVIMSGIDIANLFELDMEKLKNDKVVNLHCLFALTATVGSHIFLM